MSKISVLVGALFVVVFGATRPERQMPTMNEDMRECPHSWDSLSMHDQAAGLPGWFPGDRSNVPEFNDCQRFVEVDPLTGDRSYGGRMAIFSQLDTSGRLVLDTAEVRVPCAGPLACPNATVLTMARPAALIIAESEYRERLGIEKGANCLVVFSDAGVLRARMIPLRFVSGVDCQADVDPRDQLGVELHVKRTTIPGLSGPQHYPAVARWETNRQNDDVNIVISCASATCEIGPNGGFPSEPVYPLLALGGGDNAKRVVTVRGWYDQQYLAGTDALGELVPSRVFATFFPDPNLGLANQASDFAEWRRVGYVAVEVPEEMMSLDIRTAEAYREKYNLQVTGTYGNTKADAINTWFLCFGGITACVGPSSLIDRDNAPTCESPDFRTGTVWLRSVGADGTSKFYCAKPYLQTNGLNPPAAVRLRWSLADEGGWVRCTQGCCEIL